MLERPALSDEAILACLREAYAIQARAVEFLPIGNDATAWVYRAAAQDGAGYFAKVKKGCAICDKSLVEELTLDG